LERAKTRFDRCLLPPSSKIETQAARPQEARALTALPRPFGRVVCSRGYMARAP
jgi:hypothetical protein